MLTFSIRGSNGAPTPPLLLDPPPDVLLDPPADVRSVEEAREFRALPWPNEEQGKEAGTMKPESFPTPKSQYPHPQDVNQ